MDMKARLLLAAALAVCSRPAAAQLAQGASVVPTVPTLAGVIGALPGLPSPSLSPGNISLPLSPSPQGLLSLSLPAVQQPVLGLSASPAAPVQASVVPGTAGSGEASAARAQERPVLSALQEAVGAQENDRPGAQGEEAGARSAALMDGSQAAPAAVERVLTELRELRKQETPVWLHWRDKDTGQARVALAKIASVTDRQSVVRGRLTKQWLVVPDDYSAEIDVDLLESAVPAGLSPGEYDAMIQPEGPKMLGPELARTGLSPEQLETLRSRSRGFITAHEFLKQSSLGHSPGITLGVTDNLDQYTALTRAAGMTHWKVLYRKWFGGIRSPRPDEFMDRATRDGRPVYLFLPPMVVDEEVYPNTLGELKWLLAHPDRLGNVQLVLGGYDMFSKADGNRLFSLGIKHGKGKRRKLLLDAFRRLMAGYRDEERRALK